MGGKSLGYETDRVVFRLGKQHREIIRRYAFQHRLGSQSEAIRHLLDSVDKSDSVEKLLGRLGNRVSRQPCTIHPVEPKTSERGK